MTRHPRAAALLLALLAGCTQATRPAPTSPGVGSASYRTDATSDLTHYQLALGQTATGATPDVHRAPSYPPAMLAACPARVELPARVVVGEDGRVEDVRVTPASGQAPFAQAVRAAVGAWRYTPLTISRWAADAEGVSHPVDTEARPFSLDYVFTFRCEHGRASVSTVPDPSP